MTPSPSLSLADYATFILYIVASLALGLMAGGKQKDLKTYLLAGNQMHWMMIAISVLAALFSGISFLGAPAETYSHNLVYLWVIIAYMVATPVTTVIFLPFFYRLNFYTAYEYLEHRFDLRLRRLSSFSFIIRVCLWLALALYAPSLVITEMTGVPLWIAVVFTGLATLLYTTLGGMKAVIYTDVMQFSVLIFGIVVILYVALGKIPGGMAGAWNIAEAGGRTVFFNFDPSPFTRMSVWGAFIGGIFINLVGLVTDQVSVQRYLTASSLKEGQRALWAKLVLTLPLVGLFYLTGLVLYSFYQSNPEMAPTLASPDRLLPFFVSQQLASPIPGLLIAAILAATMSTVSAGVNSLTTATLMDFFYTGRNTSSSQEEENGRVRTAKWWTFGYGIAVTALALVISKLGTFIEASATISGFLGGPLLGVFALGVLSRRANAKGTLIGVLIGFAVVTACGLMSSISFMWYALIGCSVTYGVGLGVSLLFPAPTREQQSFSRAGMSDTRASGEIAAPSAEQSAPPLA